MVEPVRVKGIPGSPPSTLKVYQGCEFLERCDRGSEICREKKPPECTVDVRVSCHFEGEKCQSEG
jgi:peptide/nickel transport system ATP-binding protein